MMEYTLFIVLAAILFVLLVILLVLLAMYRKIPLRGPTPERGDGLIEEQAQKKQRNLELILALFAKHEVLTNAIIRQELGFDDRVIVNYMDALELMGKVRQVGKTGVDAHYELVG